MTHEEIKIKLLSAKIKKHYLSMDNYINETFSEGKMYEDNTFHLYCVRKKEISKYKDLCEKNRSDDPGVSNFGGWENIKKVLFPYPAFEGTDAYGSVVIKNVLFLNDYDKGGYDSLYVDLVTITSINRKGEVRCTTISYHVKYGRIICRDDVNSKLPDAFKRVRYDMLGGKRAVYRYGNKISIRLRMNDYNKGIPAENRQSDKQKNTLSYPRLILNTF